MRKPIKINLSKKLDEKKPREIKTTPGPVVTPKRDKQIREADKKIFKRLGTIKSAIVVLIIACLWYGQFRQIPPLINSKHGTVYLAIKDTVHGALPRTMDKDKQIETSPDSGIAIPLNNHDICITKPPILKSKEDVWKNSISFKETSTIIFFSGHGTQMNGIIESPLTPIMDSLEYRIALNEKLKVMPLWSLQALSGADAAAVQYEVAKNIPVDVQPILLSFELQELTESSGKNWDEGLPNNRAIMSIKVRCSNLRNGEVLFDQIMTQQTSLPGWAGFNAPSQPNEGSAVNGQSPARLKVQRELVDAVFHLCNKYLKQE